MPYVLLMGRGATATADENLLYGPVASRRWLPRTARSRAELRKECPSLADLDDDALLEELTAAEIVTVLCDPHASSSFQTRLCVLIRDRGWRARIPAGTRMIRELHPRKEPALLRRGQTVRVDWIFSSWIFHESADERRTIPAQLRWAGSGGYWRDAELHPGVELIRPGRSRD